MKYLDLYLDRTDSILIVDKNFGGTAIAVALPTQACISFVREYISSGPSIWESTEEIIGAMRALPIATAKTQSESILALEQKLSSLYEIKKGALIVRGISDDCPLPSFGVWETLLSQAFWNDSMEQLWELYECTDCDGAPCECVQTAKFRIDKIDPIATPRLAYLLG